MNEAKISQGTKLALDVAPSAAFLIAYNYYDFYWATAALIIATLVSVAVTYALTRRISKFMLIMAAFVAVFGGISLYLNMPWFFKLKVTIVELVFAALLYGGLHFNRLFVKELMSSSIDLPDEIWKTLTIRWALFFVAMAIVNVVIWQMFSESAWVWFKAFGLLICYFAFAIANAPLMAKHMKE